MENRPLADVQSRQLPVVTVQRLVNRYRFIPFGLVPLLGLAALLVVALGPFAFGEVQAVTEATARSALQQQGASWATASASGQWVILEGRPPSREAALAAERAVRDARADTLFGRASPVTWVISHFTWTEDPLLPPGTTRPRIGDPRTPDNAMPAPSLAEAEACDQTMAGLLANARIEFDSDSSVIGMGSHALLDAIAAAAGYCQGALRIEGYTDDVGSDVFNTDLSLRRAEAVRAALIRRGVAPDRLSSHGFGDASPVATNDTEQGRARNRRIEIRTLRSPPT